MRLGLEHNGERFQMEIMDLGDNPAEFTDFTGFRKLNRIVLFKAAFKKFILHLQADEFEEIRLMFEKLIDRYSKELPYEKNLTRVYVTNGEPDPLLKQLIG